MPDSQDKAPRDENRIPVMVGTSNQTITIGDIDFVEDVTPVPVAVDPVTHAIKLEGV